ncbi:MAG TPA: dihydroorotase [Chitinophagaceae bacterium]|nr:dihydroorotase [Chitinophagaceae bacterium]
MNIVIRQATILDPASPHHNRQTDLTVQNGVITAIGDASDIEFDRELVAENLFVSPGWVDIFTHFCDPGFEYKETLESGSAAAAAGGFTDVFQLPNTAPFVHNKAAVEYITQRSRLLPITIHPIGGITKGGEGKELAEMYDMFQSGARAFGDGLNTIQNAGLLVKALQYLKAIDATIIQIPDDKTLASGGLMHEGIVSTTLGLSGKPALAEELMVSRDIELATYTGSRLHITGVTTAKSIALIKKAKREGVNITCSVTPYHLYFSDADLKTYDTNLKVTPPLRTAADRAALQQAVLDGTVDCIASHHLPQNVDEKLVEFEYAANGMIGLQTSFSIVHTALPQLTPERIVELFSTNSRRIFGLPNANIEVGATASLTLFQPDRKWTFTRAANKSKSYNSPFLDLSLTGRPFGIIHKDNLLLNEEN